MMDNMGTVDGISASGKDWYNGIAGDIRHMFFKTLASAQDSIQISTYSLGRDNPEVNEFFDKIEEQLTSERNVNIIVDSEHCSKFARREMRDLKSRFPNRFTYQIFESESKSLHAKLLVVDRKIALVGSANISKRALVSNYEIMLKVSGRAASDISLMLDDLRKMLEDGAGD